MITLREQDERVGYQEQLAQDTAPIVLINQFHVAPEDADRLVEVWADDAAFMKEQPGYISAQLYRGTAGSTTFINIAVWESTAALRDAFLNPEFQERIRRYPASTVGSPHVFAKVAVPGICLG
ncbi:MAG: antibiotic biosynthesis monooxygenase family protein [Egibacteraceae bacterium]